jgi:hypothetical protein
MVKTVNLKGDLEYCVEVASLSVYNWMTDWKNRLTQSENFQVFDEWTDIENLGKFKNLELGKTNARIISKKKRNVMKYPKPTNMKGYLPTLNLSKYRKFDCIFYSICLDHAATFNWLGFSCYPSKDQLCDNYISNKIIKGCDTESEEELNEKLKDLGPISKVTIPKKISEEKILKEQLKYWRF